MRRPSDLARFYQYWQLALSDLEAARVLYRRQVFEEELADPTEISPPRCGFFRHKPNIRSEAWKAEYGGTLIPVAIWLEQPVDPETGELTGDEYFVAKVGLEKERITRSELALCAIFGRGMDRPVTEEAYRFFQEKGHWPDDIAKQRSLF